MPTATDFPPVLSSLRIVNSRSGDADSSVTYRNDNGLWITYYLYRPAHLGTSDIERGASSKAVVSEFAYTAVGMTEMKKQGVFSEIEYTAIGGHIDLPTKSGPLPAHWAVFKYRTPQQGNIPLIGQLIVTGYQNWFLKIRVSYPDVMQNPDAPKATAEQQRDAHINAGANILQQTRLILN